MTTEPESGPPTPPAEQAPPPPVSPPAQAPAAPTPPAAPEVPAAAAPPAATAPAPETESTSDLLRSMLSRAVEGQLDDQHELANSITDMRSQLVRLAQEIGQLRARPPHDDAADAQINTVTVEMREAVRFLSERLDGVTRMVAQRGEELADIRTALTAIDAHVRSQAETIGVLSAGMQTLPSYGERVSVLQDNLQVLHRQLVGIEAAVAGSKDDEVVSRLTAIESSVAATPDNSAVLERLTAIEASVAGTPDNSAVLERLTAIESSISAADGAGIDGAGIEAAVVAALAPLEARLGELSEATAGHAEALSAVQGKLEPLASDVTTIGGNVAGLVEGSADGAALDSRVNESVTQAVRATEQRLMAHIDEAVLALAETLLRRRSIGSAGQITGTPVAASSPNLDADPLVDDAEATASIPVTTADVEHEADTDAADDIDTDDEPDTDGNVDDADELDLEPTGAGSVDQATGVAATAETTAPPETSRWDSDLDTHSEAAPVDVDAAHEGLELDDASDEATLADDVDGPPAQADEVVDEPTAALTPLIEAAATPQLSPGSPWSPETPPARDPADPTVELAPQKRKWGRRNR